MRIDVSPTLWSPAEGILPPGSTSIFPFHPIDGITIRGPSPAHCDIKFGRRLKSWGAFTVSCDHAQPAPPTMCHDAWASRTHSPPVWRRKTGPPIGMPGNPSHPRQWQARAQRHLLDRAKAWAVTALHCTAVPWLDVLARSSESFIASSTALPSDPS